MFSSAGAVHGGPPQARFLAALDRQDEGGHFFLAATSSPQQDGNEMHLLRFDEEASTVHHEASYLHPGTLTALCPSTENPDQLLAASRSGLALWKLGSDAASAGQTSDGPHAGSELVRVAAVDMSDVASVAMQRSQAGKRAAAGRPNEVALVDLETSVLAHKYGTTDVDFNPNKPNVVMSAGEDRLVKFWDLRKPSAPLRALAGHTHWVCAARYNQFHDQLVLSAGSDSAVNLWRVSSISSSPLIDLEGDPSTNMDTMDTKIKAYDGHEAPVYAVAWSATDAWVFASLSHDGRVVVSLVPSTEKYKILL